MDLPVMPPLAPMLAKSAKELPVAAGMSYEPKWDGFRCIVFKDGAEVELGSRKERPLTRYFPELVEATRAQLPSRCVIDGEIVIARGDRLDFEALLQRIHPADSRVTRLAAETPAWFVAFDLLALDGASYLDAPFAERREALQAALATVRAPVHLTAATTDVATAREWFDTFEGAGLDGVVAKPAGIPYTPDKRLMFKVKHERTADCVVAGFRWHKSGPVVGSLLLGLFHDEPGHDKLDPGGSRRLQHVGVCSSFTAARRVELLDELAPYRTDALAGHPWADWAEAEAQASGRLPGAQSRWNAGKDLTWEPLRPDLVVEVAYDHMEGTRFRHTAQFRRWRPDRDRHSCTYAQLEVPVRYNLSEVLDSG